MICLEALEHSISSLPLLSGPLSTGVIVPVRASYIDKIDLFENYLYLIGRWVKKKESILKKEYKYERTMNGIS